MERSHNMAPPPRISVGSYWYTRTESRSQVRCKAYTAPPEYDLAGNFSGGSHVCTLSPCTFVGPVEAVNYTSSPISGHAFSTILVRGFWINVWARNERTPQGVWYAWRVPERSVEGWRTRGWQD